MRKRGYICTLWLIVTMILPWRAVLASDDSGNGKKLDDILSELQKIRLLLQFQSGHAQQDKGAESKSMVYEVKEGSPVLGSREAPFTIIEFMDYQCPFCQQFFKRTFRDLKERYIDTHKVRFYVVDFPLTSHPKAFMAAQAARCAGEQGQFWALYGQMQAEAETLGLDKISEIAGRAGIDVTRLRRCMESEKYRELIEQDIGEANSKGIRGTPAFIIGKSTPPNGVEGELIMGAIPYYTFEQKLNGFMRR